MTRKSPNRTWLTGPRLAIAVTLLSIVGCGDGDGGEGAVDAGGPGFSASEDDEPETALDDSSLITVFVELPTGEELTGTAVVALEDITVLDTAAPELTRVELPVEELQAQGNVVEVVLPVPLDGQTEVNASVHIDSDSDGTRNTGDWISPEQVLITSFSGATVSVRLEPV